MPSHPLPSMVLIVLLFFILIALLVFLETLQVVLKKCAPTSRTMKPGQVWLQLVPVFGFVWQFVNVVRVGKSLENEFARLGIPCPEPTMGQKIGVAMCICNCFFAVPIPLLRDLASIPGLILWIVYWNRIADYSRLLDTHQAINPASPTARVGPISLGLWLCCGRAGNSLALCSGQDGADFIVSPKFW